MPQPLARQKGYAMNAVMDPKQLLIDFWLWLADQNIELTLDDGGMSREDYEALVDDFLATARYRGEPTQLKSTSGTAERTNDL